MDELNPKELRMKMLEKAAYHLAKLIDYEEKKPSPNHERLKDWCLEVATIMETLQLIKMDIKKTPKPLDEFKSKVDKNV